MRREFAKFFIASALLVIYTVVCGCEKYYDREDVTLFSIRANINGEIIDFTGKGPKPSYYFPLITESCSLDKYSFNCNVYRFEIELRDSLQIVGNKWYTFDYSSSPPSCDYFFSFRYYGVFSFISGRYCFQNNNNPEIPISFSFLFDDCTFVQYRDPPTLNDTISITNGRIDIYESLFERYHNYNLPDFLTSPF